MIYYPNQINSEDERRGIINYYVWITGFNQDVYRYSTDRGRSACNKNTSWLSPRCRHKQLRKLLVTLCLIAPCVSIKQTLPLTNQLRLESLYTVQWTMHLVAQDSFHLYGQLPKLHFTLPCNRRHLAWIIPSPIVTWTDGNKSSTQTR